VRYRWLTISLALVALSACGGDGDDGDGGDRDGGAGSQARTAPSEEETLGFERVEGFTVDYMERRHDDQVSSTDPKKVYCPSPQWSDDEAMKRQTADVHRAESAEVLVCMEGDPSPAVSYLRFEDAAAASEAPATTPSTETATLVAGDTLVTAFFAGASEQAYIDALNAECGCGEVIQTKPAR
jgi:hypothetical protein